MAKKERIKVRITETNGWYNKGEIHEVGNYVVFSYFGGASFEVGERWNGINLSDCVVLTEEESVPEYTMEELAEKIGHQFKIKQ